MKGIFTLGAFLLPLAILCQTDTTLPVLSTAHQILKDRVILFCPDGAVNVPRPHDILSTPPKDDQETRITYNRDQERLVIFAQEMNAFSTPRFLEDAKGLYTAEERDDYAFRVATTTDKFKAILTTPLKTDSTQDAILIKTILIQTEDSTLIQIGAYINPSAYKELAFFRALSEKILLSAKGGKRKLQFHARKETLPVLGDISNLEIDCPENYIVLSEKGFDYNSYQVRKVKPFTTQVSGGMIVYTGLQPSPIAGVYKFEESGAKKITRTFLGKDTEWRCYADKSLNVYLQEVLYDAPECGKDMKILVSLLASDEKELDALIPLSEKLILLNR
jgi:hypothetical protein